MEIDFETMIDSCGKSMDQMKKSLFDLYQIIDRLNSLAEIIKELNLPDNLSCDYYKELKNMSNRISSILNGDKKSFDDGIMNLIYEGNRICEMYKEILSKNIII